MGGIINDDTVGQLKCQVVAGGANNQLQRPENGQMLADRGIVYVPDYVLNAGGVISVADELAGYDRERVIMKITELFTVVSKILTRAADEGMTRADG